MSVRQQIIDYSKAIIWVCSGGCLPGGAAPPAGGCGQCRRFSSTAVPGGTVVTSAKTLPLPAGRCCLTACTGFIFPGMPVLVRIAASIKTLPLGRWTAPRRRSGIIA